METHEFLAKILPPTGWYFVARVFAGKVIHQACQSTQEMALFVHQYDGAALNTYHACAAYHQPEIVETNAKGETVTRRRTHKNVRALKSFWMDLDVEPGNPSKYGTQAAALDGLVDFCTATKLPLPMIVSSGFGIHIYWSLENEILPEQWRPVAESLKQLAIHYDFKTDATCTSDPARILRPTGSFNRKQPALPKLVEVVADAEQVAFADFRLCVDAAARACGASSPVRTVRSVATTSEQVNQGFEIKRDFPPCSAQKVAERCAQVRQVRDTKGNVSEPLWYAAVQLLTYALEGDELIHQWSQGHPSYSAAETDKKIAQNRSQGIGPTTCTRFEGFNPEGCKDCPFKGKISSPVQLGAQVAAAPAPVAKLEVDGVVTETVLPQPPNGFTRGANGGIYYEDPDGILHKIYEYDLYPLELSRDEALGYETVRWRHHTPHDGVQDFVMRSSLIAKPAEFESTLRDNHVKPLIKGKMLAFGDGYLRELQKNTKLRKLYKAQGWKDDNTAFVLGEHIYTKTGIAHAGFSHGARDFLSSFKHKGDLATWRTLTWALNHPGFEPHRLALLLGFIPPLLPLAGRQGFMACMLGDSGAGKSTMAEFMCSIWGDKRGGWVGMKDTELSAYLRLGAYCNLPVYMDEGTQIAGEALRDLVYSIPIGKSKASMRADYSLRPVTEWQTILVTSSNECLQDKLQLAKANAEAESLRLFEFNFPKVPEFGPIAKLIPGVLTENYGVAGREFIRRLVQSRDEVKERLATLVGEVELEFGMRDEERFWTQCVALALYGGKLAQEWGIIDFDPDSIKPWLLTETRRMRGDVQTSKVSAVQILSDYINEHMGERLVVSEINHGLTSVALKPMHSISQRYEKDKELLYISKPHLNYNMKKRHHNVSNMKKELITLGILVEADRNYTLGKGTDMTGGQVACWVIKADHPLLVGVKL